LSGQPVVALNPDPARIDGVLLPFDCSTAATAITLALSNPEEKFWRDVTMAEARLNDGQSLLAVNDLFVGQKTHASARYRIRFGGREENQSSSGIIVSTGAGSTGWNRSILTGAAGIVARQGSQLGARSISFRLGSAPACLQRARAFYQQDIGLGNHSRRDQC
jgi:hypothetical protein